MVRYKQELHIVHKVSQSLLRCDRACAPGMSASDQLATDFLLRQLDACLNAITYNNGVHRAKAACISSDSNECFCTGDSANKL
jgi:hypothetical protein